MEKIVNRNFSAKETCLRIGVSRPTLSRLVASRQIGCFRVGTRLLFSEQHITNFLASVERPAYESFVRRRARVA
jgi:excisionase family DNA binding protein